MGRQTTSSGIHECAMHGETENRMKGMGKASGAWAVLKGGGSHKLYQEAEIPAET